MIRRAKWQVLLAAALSACSGAAPGGLPTQTSAPPSAPPATIGLPTELPSLATSTATRAAPTQATPGTPTSTPLPQQGHISVPTGVGDAGNYYIYAGNVVTLTWNGAPLGCEQYQFVYTDISGIRVLVGADSDSSDGVAIEWKVPEFVGGEDLRIEALCDGSIIRSGTTGSIYSGALPPDGVCVVASSTIGALDLFGDPSLDSIPFAYLSPGDYARVLEQAGGGWILVDTTDAEQLPPAEQLPATGWVSESYGVEFFGPCDG